ncbi:MAG: AbrB/MazE/SpoVT family DNA-binding domain-containing protein [Spirochaetaceae bacterium]|jgi:bifunctional DNA-binding transcriptional regulator/antitoxin component of YhaV-PrlF toxin-antitoxin module|nr:AbrB/MazE/SpoVT family DNA-binding domain-containing protein [Spirochaetaceae bacterium]
MEIAKLRSKGQITIPDIRQKMDLKKVDKILFFEENGKYYIQNSNSAALKIMQNVMKGEAEKAGFKNPDDVVKYIKDMRKRPENNYGNNG